MAGEQDLDLVAMSNDKIPACKIMDYAKFMFDQKKRAKENMKANRANRVELKEVKFNPNIAENDLSIKAKTASRLLSEGDNVKVTITYKGRMIQFISKGIDKINEFETLVEFKHSIKEPPKIEGNRVSMIITPCK